MMQTLDALLSAPLPEIADNGFSARLMARIDAEQQREAMLTSLVIGVAAASVIPFLPWLAIYDALKPVLVNANALFGMAIAGAVVAMSLLAAREFEQN